MRWNCEGGCRGVPPLPTPGPTGNAPETGWAGVGRTLIHYRCFPTANARHHQLRADKKEREKNPQADLVSESFVNYLLLSKK